MSKSLQSTNDANQAIGQWKSLSRIGGIAALVQFGCVITTIAVFAVLGGEPASPQEYFDVLTTDRLLGTLRMDFASLINVLLYSVTSLAIYGILQRYNKAYAAFGAAMIFLGIAFSAGSHSGISWLQLSDQYAAAATEVQRTQLLAAGQALLASDWWNSTSGYISGIFLQGGMVVLSIVMLQRKVFSKYTAWAGILSNGLDWVHVLLIFVAPGLANAILWAGGIFYIAWYPLLAWDLLRQGKR